MCEVHCETSLYGPGLQYSHIAWDLQATVEVYQHVEKLGRSDVDGKTKRSLNISGLQQMLEAMFQ